LKLNFPSFSSCLLTRESIDCIWPVLFGFGVQDVSCIKDLTSLYEAATIEDIYVAYEQLKVDEDSLYSCIGVAGAQAGEEINGK
jgi:hypothetical protein